MKVLYFLFLSSLLYFVFSVDQQQSSQIVPVQQVNSGSTKTSENQKINQQQNQISQNSQTQTPKLQKYQVGEIIDGISYKVNGGVSFYQIQVKQTEKKYLFFTLIDMEHNNDVKDIGIKVFGQKNKQPILKCEKDNLDSCYLPKQLIPEKKSIFVVVKCLDDCKFRIKAYWSSIQHLKPGDVHKFMFGEETTQLYHVQLSKYPTDFYQVRIVLKPEVTRRPFDNIKIYGTYSATMPSQQHYDFISKNFWSDGQGLFLKRKDMKDLDFNIILAGQADTVYVMTCEVIDKEHHEVQLGQTISEYLQTGQTTSYHLTFADQGKQNILYDQYISRISIFSGNLSFAYYTDKQMTKKYLFQPYEYMRDSELLFLKSQISQVLQNGIYIKAQAKTTDSTFMIKFFGRSQYQAIQMVENIYQFVPLKLKQQKLAYFHFGQWQTALQGGQQKLKFTIKFISVAGDTGVSFRVCTASLDKCLSSDYKTGSEVIKPLEQTKINEVGFSFTIQVAKKYMTQINQVQKQGTILMILDGRRLDQKYNISLAAVQFLNSNQMMYLREGRTVEDSLSANAMKYYKYINSDPKVIGIKVHLNIISGSVQISGMRKDPRNNKAVGINPQNNILTFDKNMTDPLFIAVLGIEKAIYSLSVQIIRSSQSRAISSLTVAEDIQYKIQVPSNNYQIIEVHPIFDKIILSYKSSCAIKVCPLNDQNACSDTAIEQLNQGEIQLEEKSLRSKQIVFANFNKDLIAEITFIYHSSDDRHCQRKQLSQIYDEEIDSGTCYGFLIQQIKSLQVIISRSQLLQAHVVLFMCDNYLDLPSNLERYQIGIDLMNKACKSTTSLKELKLFFGSGSVQGQKQHVPIKIRSVVQYQNGNIIIPQGISYDVKSLSREQPIKTFVYNIINQKYDVNLLLTEIHGGFQIYADLIQETFKNTKKLTKFQATFTSQTFRDFYGRPYLTIKASDIQKHNCVTCSIIMSIYSKQAIGKSVQFSMQVLTNQSSHKVLDNHQIVQDYISNNGIKYYSFKNLHSNSQILVEVSDHNQNCGSIYLSDKQFPGELNFLAKENGNKLIYNQAQNKQYYIAYIGNKECPYTIRVYPSDSKITTLQRGKQVLISLNKDQVKYFLFKHYSKAAFKVVCMQKFGQIKLFANQTNSQNMMESFDKLDYKKFTFQSHQKNILYISVQNENFCQNCYYILAVSALQNTESSLILTDVQTLIPITVQKTFYDYFQTPNELSFYSYHKIQALTVKPSVKSGKILISAFYQNQQIQKQFSSSNDPTELIINFTKTDSTNQSQKNFHKNALPTFADKVINPKANQAVANNDDRRNQIVIRIKSLSDKTLYSTYVESMQSNSPLSGLVQKYKIESGQPNYVLMNTVSEKTTCIQGFLRDKTQKIIFTANLDDLQSMIKIKFAIRVNGKQVTNFVKTTRTRNIIALQFTRDMFNSNIKAKAIDFEVCMNMEKPKKQNEEGQEFSLIIMQIDNINFLPLDTEVVIQKPMHFVIHPEKAFIIDLFTCQGSSSIAYANTPSELQSNDFSDLQIIGLSGHNHAMKVQKSATTFVKVKGQKAIVKWMPYDFEYELGVGYVKYQVGEISYDQQFNQIKINFGSIKKIKETKTSISSITYEIVVGNSLKDIKYGTECSHFNQQHIIVQTILKQTKLAQQNTMNSWVLKKQRLSKFFGKDLTIYVSIVANLQIKTPELQSSSLQSKNRLQHEHYKFIYHSQQISNELYMPNTIEKISIPNLIMIIFGVIIVLFLTTCLCTRKILPMIARIKSSNLVQEAGQVGQEYKGEKEHSGFEQLPPSSQRRGIETQDAMK